MFEVEIAEDFIDIKEHGKSVLYWEASEWESGEVTVPQIANAIKMALTEPQEFHSRIRESKHYVSQS